MITTFKNFKLVKEGYHDVAMDKIKYTDSSIKLRFELFSMSKPNDDIIGTIRTVPENYYVASVHNDLKLTFDGIEGMTKDIDQVMVEAWYNDNIENITHIVNNHFNKLKNVVAENSIEEKYYKLDSIKSWIDKTNLMIYPDLNNQPDLTKGYNLHTVEDSWFEKLNDIDFGTIDNLLNSANLNESHAYTCSVCGERAEHEEIEENPNLRCGNCGNSDWMIEEAVLRSNLYPGMKVKIADLSGIDSNKIVTITDRRNIKVDGRGVPQNVEGAYKQVDWNKEAAFEYEDGTYGLMFLNRLDIVNENNNIIAADSDKTDRIDFEYNTNYFFMTQNHNQQMLLSKTQAQELINNLQIFINQK